jgi:DNA polymerase III subunit delta
MSFGARGGKGTEADFIAAITKRPDIRLFLVFGQDESAIADIVAQLALALGPDAERIDLDSDKIRNDPALLADEANSLSLFGGTRYIRLTVRREEGQAAFENLLEGDGKGDIGGAPVIAIAGNLTKTSKLRKLAESHKRAMAFICYIPNESEAAASVMKMASVAGLKLDRTLAARIARYTGQDRKLAAMEVEKLALYYDAAPDRPQTVEIAAFEALSAETGEENVQELVNKVMGGQVRELGTELMVARQMGVDAIRITRALQRRVTQLAGLRAKVDTGSAPAHVVESNRAIFWKERSAMTNQLTRWPSARLAGLNGHLIDIEERLMAVKADLGSVLLEQELTKIARAAARAK